MDHLPLVELVTHPLASDDPCEVVEAVRVDGGPRLEVPLGSRVTVDHAAGELTPTVHVELLAARVRYVDRSEVHDPPAWDRTRQLLLAAARVLQGGTVPAELHAETDGDHVSRLGRLLEEHALAAAAPVPPLGPDQVPPGGYRTRSGRVLTEADLDALVTEAERGYAVDHLDSAPPPGTEDGTSP